MNSERNRQSEAGREPNEASNTLGQSEGPAAERAEVLEGREPSAGGLPPAGPHADPSLINPDATPGAGTLPPAGRPGDDEVDQATG